MEVYQSFGNRESIQKIVTIKNLVGVDILSVPSATAIDAIIDDQIVTQPLEIFNVTSSGSLSAMYNTIKWAFYQKSGIDNLEAIVGQQSSSSITAHAIKVLTIPRETLKHRITPSSLSSSISFAPTSTTWYVKDEPVVSSTGDSLFYGKLKIGTASNFATSASLTSVGEVFYNYGLMVFRGSIIGNASLSAVLSPSLDMRFYDTGTTTAIDVLSMSFRREQQKTKRIYFCRAYNDTFNYSNNPTYRNADGTIRQSVLDAGNVTYVTTVGAYDNNNNLLFVAKVNPVSKKTSENEVIFKIAVSY